MIYFLSLFHLLLWSQSFETLDPIDIEAYSLPEENPRSVSWPQIHFKENKVINLPQVDDAFNALNGVQVRTQGSPTFSIRGSAQSGRALVLYNEIPLNFASSFGAPRIFLTKELIGQSHIIKGPASLLYGSQALSGSLNFESIKFQKTTFVGTLSDTDESFVPGRENTSLSHNSFQIASPLYKHKKDFLQFSYFTEKDDGKFPFQTQNASGVRSYNSRNMNRLVLEGKKMWKNLSLKFDSIVGRQIQQSPGPTNFSLLTREETEGLLFALTPHYFFNDQQSLRSKLSFMNSESDFLESGNTSNNNQQTLVSQNEYIVDFSGKTKLQIFADAFSHRLDNSFVGQDLKQTQLEAGSLLSFFSSQKLKHQLGVRFLESSQKALPTLMTHYYLAGGESWLSYSQGFKNPTLTDLFSASPFFVGNPNLRPEQSEQFEVGFKKIKRSPLHEWLLDVRVFHLNYSNFIESFEVTPGVFSRENRGKGYSRGFDLESRFKSGSWETFLRYNFLETKDRSTGQVFRLSPKHQIALGASYKVSSWNFEVQNNHWYQVFDFSNNQPVALDDWQQWNFLIHKSFSKDLLLSFGLINAFNEGKELTLFYPEPQRKYWLRLQWQMDLI